MHPNNPRSPQVGSHSHNKSLAHPGLPIWDHFWQSRTIDLPTGTILEENLQKHLHQFESDCEAGVQLIRIGESEADDSIEVVELAAWTMVANLILNLDEVLTKG